MQLLVAYRDDPAGHNMAKFISQEMKYDGFVFLSKHAAESGVLALTCHSTGNFSEAKFGGNNRQVAIPHPHIQKSYLQKLWQNRNDFSEFQITIEATHHGPTDLNKPSIFIEIGTTEKQWNDSILCNSIAKIVVEVMKIEQKSNPVAICFGGTHYPDKFTKELIHGKFALGTVIPKHALDFLDEELFYHILDRNNMAKTALLDWEGLGQNKQKVLDMLNNTNLEVIRL